jgi:hypothetical protein
LWNKQKKGKKWVFSEKRHERQHSQKMMGRKKVKQTGKRKKTQRLQLA